MAIVRQPCDRTIEAQPAQLLDPTGMSLISRSVKCFRSRTVIGHNTRHRLMFYYAYYGTI